ncbi:MAG TPA: SGNH/GDSL hydrolase family protein [Bryobacteraceae bacterium]
MRLLTTTRALALLAIPVFAQSDFYLKDKDTVVFYGDSITDQRLYTVAAETFVLTRFPDLHVRFVHSGWGGDKVSGGGGGNIETRIKRDVSPYHPTVVTIMLGMNDGKYKPLDDDLFTTYKTGYEKILSLIRQDSPDARFTLIEPSPYDDVTRAPSFPDGYNSVLIHYGEYLQNLAQRTSNTSIADLNTGVVAMLRKAFASDPTLAPRIIPDRVHPGWAGHLIMAAELLKAWNAPKLVTSVDIDAKEMATSSLTNTSVTGLRELDDAVVWTQHDTALPMPLPDQEPATLLAVKSSDFMDRLDVQWLRVTGLDSDKRFSLAINGLGVGEFTGGQLSSGMNLATLDTPMMRQASQVHAYTVKRAAIHQLRWRQLQIPFEKDGLPRMASILDQMDALDADLEARQHAAARPSAAYYELTPLK